MKYMVPISMKNTLICSVTGNPGESAKKKKMHTMK